MLTTVLFDLDGTLLPMDQEKFVKSYLRRLAAYMAPHGYDPDSVTATLWTGTGLMMKNDGHRSNEAVFWDYFAQTQGEERLKDKPLFDTFYATEFQKVAQDCGHTPKARALMDRLKAAGLRRALATNPLFPTVATESRVRWAGLEPEDFALITTYENSRFCKPSLDYYRDILDALGCPAEECVMVGNDTAEDMAAEALGMKVFLLTDCLINRAGAELSRWPHGGYEELSAFLGLSKEG